LAELAKGYTDCIAKESFSGPGMAIQPPETNSLFTNVNIEKSF
jgi:hypothetical protein